ncbi:MAG: 16S rRNA (guanine(527)-N(7))-methyltransferase RsmG [Nitrospira sp.]|nr:16S rRNA (guanine(527)-N(7))-methyltransferase RsmG [Nitrospira sp.]
MGVPLQPEHVTRFMTYFRHLKEWNRLINLTSIQDDREIIVKHFVDSLACLSVESIGKGSRIVDIGSGAGFPGIPLKIVRDDLQITLVEPVEKKVAFLLSVVGLLRLDRVSVYCGTIKQFAAHETSLKKFDYITARALRTDEIFEYGGRLMFENGKAILYLTKPYDRGSRPEWALVTEREFDLPMGFGHRVISIVRCLAP